MLAFFNYTEPIHWIQTSNCCQSVEDF